MWTNTFHNEMAQGCPCHLLLFPRRHIQRHIRQHHILSLHCIPDQWSIFYTENWCSSCLVNSGLSQGQEVAHLPAEVGKQPSHRLKTDGPGSSMTFGQQSISKDWTDIERNRQQTSGMHSSCISSSSAQKISPCLCSRYISVDNIKLIKYSSIRNKNLLPKVTVLCQSLTLSRTSAADMQRIKKKKKIAMCFHRKIRTIN